MDKKFCLLLAVILFVGFSSFQEVNPYEVLIQDKLKEKIETYKLSLRKVCDEKLLKEAEAIVDSTLLVEAKKKTVDSVEKPPLPNKPIKPDILVPKDTTAVKPIIE